MNQPRTLEPIQNVHILIYSTPTDAKQFAALLVEKANVPFPPCALRPAPRGRGGPPQTGLGPDRVGLRPRRAAYSSGHSAYPDSTARDAHSAGGGQPTGAGNRGFDADGRTGRCDTGERPRLVNLVWQELAPRLQVPADIDDHVGPIYASEQELRRARAGRKPANKYCERPKRWRR